MKLSCILLVTQAIGTAGKEPTTIPVLVNVASPSYMHKIGGFYRLFCFTTTVALLPGVFVRVLSLPCCCTV